MTKRGIVVSDLHCGSIYGLLPPGMDTFEGQPRPMNPGQEYLWACWKDFAERARAAQPSFVIVNGDSVDGNQWRNAGSEISLIDHRDQRRAAIMVLQHLQRRLQGKVKWYFTQGTPYHVGQFGDAEEDIAEALGAERYGSVGTGQLCREALWLDVDGVILEACHHISVSSGFYRLTAIDREGQWSALSAKDASKGVPKADCLIRSHVHYFSYGEHASKQMLTTPCWELQTRYMRKNSLHRMHPDIGGIILDIDARAKKRGEAPVRVTKELYALPPVPVTTL